MTTPNSSDPTRDDPTASVPDAPETSTENAEEASFAELLSEFEQQHHADAVPGEILEGIVLQVTADSVIVDIGRKREGLLPAEEVSKGGSGAEIAVGDTIQVSVSGSTPEGYYRLSKIRVKRPVDWTSLEKAFEEGSVIGGMVAEVIKGGLRVDVGARAFMPASRSGTRDAAEMEALVGQEIRCKVIQLDTAKEDVVVDRRAVLEAEAAAERERTFSALEEGSVVGGTVRGLTDFGAFVDLGGIDGLLHVTDMSWGRVNKPADVVSEGQRIDVKILKVDREKRRISLSLKDLTPDPWDRVAERYPVGARVRGTVVRLAGFGAFVELEPGVDGLIHASEMSWSKKQVRPSDVVKKGEAVEAVVLSVSAGERRIGLGLKQALGDPWDDIKQKFPIGGAVEGTVMNLAKFGAFVDLGTGIEGMIHIGDITNEKRLNHPNEVLSEGQKVRASVLEIDTGRRRIRLSMKQLEPTSIDEFIAEHSAGDKVTGRVVESRGTGARVELGEGVEAACRIPHESPQAAESKKDAGPTDIASLSAMLASKWKGGGGEPAAGSRGLQAGQVRDFRILVLDAEKKRIEVEPV